MKLQLFLIYIILSFSTNTWADKGYTIILPNHPVPTEGHLKQESHTSPSGQTFTLNSVYYMKNGKPWYPVSGEMHYPRVPRDEWEESLLKMKASGVTVIATYVFWNIHEEAEGQYDWKENKDLRRFIELCRKHDLHVWLRIGPWCHGEARYGGFPDWLVSIEGGTRKDNPVYLKYVQRFFNEIGQQTKGLYFKDEGPIIGVQIENEYAFNNRSRLKHLLNLKRIAMEAGIDTPYYTATGWPQGDLKQTELIPVWGGYPEAPWDSRVTELPLSRNYLFGSWANDPAVGADLLGKQESATTQELQYPYSTAEMGGGNQITYHRRPIIASKDIVAQSYVKVGSGANMMGYYMYHGGSNPIGKYTTFQESRATKYPNDYPIISYDFYAPIREYGQLHESYHGLRVLHTFLNDFGASIAPTSPVFPAGNSSHPEDNETLRISVRSQENSGYIFINNYQRLLAMKEQKGICLCIQTLDGETLKFPSLDIASDEQLIMPFNMDIDGHRLKYATVQPFCILQNKVPTYVFFSHPNTISELSFSAETLKEVTLNGQRVDKTGNVYTLKCKSGQTQLIQLTATNEKQTNLLLLTEKQVSRSWKINQKGKDFLCITSSQLIPHLESLTIRNIDENQFEINIYPADGNWGVPNGLSVINERKGIFQNLRFETKAASLPVSFQEEKHPELHIPRTLLLPEDNRLENVPDSCPGPQYFVNFKPVPTSSYYTVKVPQLPSSLKKAYLMIDYTGDTGALYNKGTLLADDFYAGAPMIYDLGRKTPQHHSEYLFQVIPFSPEVNIYLDSSARKRLTLSLQGVHSVRIVPVYDMILTTVN